MTRKTKKANQEVNDGKHACIHPLCLYAQKEAGL